MDELFWDIVKNLAAVTRELSTGNTSGQYAVGREPDLNGAYFVNLTMFFYPESTKMPTEAEEALAPFLGKLRAADLDYIYSVDALPKISSFLTIPRAVDLGGGGYIQGNVLLSHDFTYSETGLSQMADKLSELEYHPGDLFTVNVLGGSVISNGKSIDSAVHPGWRSSSLLVVVMRPFLPDFAAQTRAHDRLTNIDMPALLSIEKKPLAVYLNEADPNERDFRNLFWGNNYPRLLRIKRKWDPDGLFVVRKGVGSEMWDEEGVCRVFDSAKEL
ncbi:hypothetical protein VTN31DRAFT_3521 [Thermomyces dupontii]|uniref:uncharacterized protein n=1 Tax=Talaromyces thermophilus TaxID=28565 RepID=UPI003742EC75